MKYKIHNTRHLEKRSRERGFTIKQVLETVGSPTNILKQPPRRGNHSGMIWLFFRAYGSNVLVVVASSKPPIVEIDTEATAAYVRFGRGKVVRTEPFGGADSLVTVDYDQKGRIIGIEVIGRKEFGITHLLKDFPLEIDGAALSRARYVSADLVAKRN